MGFWFSVVFNVALVYPILGVIFLGASAVVQFRKKLPPKAYSPRSMPMNGRSSEGRCSDGKLFMGSQVNSVSYCIHQRRFALASCGGFLQTARRAGREANSPQKARPLELREEPLVAELSTASSRRPQTGSLSCLLPKSEPSELNPGNMGWE